MHGESAVRFDGLHDLDKLLTMKQHHRVEVRHTWDRKSVKTATVRHNDGHGRKSLELFGLFVREVVVRLVHRVGLEADAKVVENDVVVADINLVWLELVADRFAQIPRH